MIRMIAKASQRMLTHRRGLIKRLILIISISGFMAQVSQVSMMYFRYTTTTQVKIFSPAIIKQHGVAICVRYNDIIDMDRVCTETGVRLKHVQSLDDGIDLEDKLTVDQIFSFTPHEDEFISSCFSRPDNWRYSFHNGSDCYNVFNVSRFMTLEFMCYRIIVKQDKRLSLLSVTQSSFLQYKIYEITLGQKFRSSVMVIPVVFTDGYPFQSRDYTSSMPQFRVGDSINFTYNIFKIYPSDISFSLLAKPYDTGCDADVDVDGRYGCKRDCMIEEYGNFDRAPAFELLHLPLKLKAFSVKDVNDTRMRQSATDSYNMCFDKCMKIPCEYGYSKTTSSVMKDSGLDIRFSLLTSIDSDIRIIAQESMSFIEYFSFVSGCFGTWFGLSFLSLNTIRTMGRRRMKIGGLGKRPNDWLHQRQGHSGKQTSY